MRIFTRTTSDRSLITIRALPAALTRERRNFVKDLASFVHRGIDRPRISVVVSPHIPQIQFPVQCFCENAKMTASGVESGLLGDISACFSTSDFPLLSSSSSRALATFDFTFSVDILQKSF